MKTNRPDIKIGDVFDRLTVTASDGRNRHRHPMWICECSCGSVCRIDGGNMKNGHTRSCGCLAREARRKVVHGEAALRTRSKEYGIWVSMIGRCYNENDRAYKDYGGRGIKMCRRWRESYTAFLADMGRRPSPKHSIDRIDNDRGYAPNNCRWATQKEQGRNTRRTRMIAMDGERRPLIEWAERYNIQPGTLLARLDRQGMTLKQALKTPNQKAFSVEYNGETRTLKEWCRLLDLRYGTVWNRIKNLGMSPEQAIEVGRGRVQ